jgi:hypothetical protein
MRRPWRRAPARRRFFAAMPRAWSKSAFRKSGIRFSVRKRDRQKNKSMIPESGNRFSEEIMLNQEAEA